MNTHIRAMLSSHPIRKGEPLDAIARCIEMCLDCAETCRICADACLSEEEVADLRRCIRLNLDCADLCAVTARLTGRRAGPGSETPVRDMLHACMEACRLCAEECHHHAAHHDHCRVCAEACDACSTACREALSQVSAVQ